MIGIKIAIEIGKIATCSTIPVINQPLEMNKIAIESDSVISRISTSYVSLLRMRPIGVVSKYDIGARITLFVISKNNLSAHLEPP
jgi:hypothetical protein